MPIICSSQDSWLPNAYNLHNLISQVFLENENNEAFCVKNEAYSLILTIMVPFTGLLVSIYVLVGDVLESDHETRLLVVVYTQYMSAVEDPALS